MESNTLYPVTYVSARQQHPHKDCSLSVIVHLSTAAQSFLIEGIRGDKFAATLHSEESCRCKASGTRWHIIPANLSTGIDDSREKKDTQPHPTSS